MTEILFMFSYGVAYLETNLNMAKRKKEHFMAGKWGFFKSNMDALTVLSIWDSERSQLMSLIIAQAIG